MDKEKEPGEIRGEVGETVKSPTGSRKREAKDLPSLKRKGPTPFVRKTTPARDSKRRHLNVWGRRILKGDFGPQKAARSMLLLLASTTREEGARGSRSSQRR